MPSAVTQIPIVSALAGRPAPKEVLVGLARSRAVLFYNRHHRKYLADRIVITPSHILPEGGGFKYNPMNGGPADTDITSWVENRANELLRNGTPGVKRVSFQKAMKARTTREEDRAADRFRPIHKRTNGVNRWVSLEVSPLLAYDTRSTLRAAKSLFSLVKRLNLSIKIPGTKEGLPAIKDAIAEGKEIL